MNKIEYINLGGIPLAIDVDAAKRLQDYLYELDDYFGKSEYADEIIRDIELRLAELIEESMGHRKVANMVDVEHSIKIMGYPEQFESTDTDGDAAYKKRRQEGSPDEKQTYHRKLYRDPQSKILGGICSGLSVYFDIKDPIWIRLAFVLFTLTGGAGILLYIIMWIIMPEAKTSIDRLRMHGESVDLRNIERMVENGIDHISGFADKVSEKFSKKKR